MTVGLSTTFHYQLETQHLHVAALSTCELASDKTKSHSAYLKAAMIVSWRANAIFKSIGYFFAWLWSLAADKQYKDKRFTLSGTKRFVIGQSIDLAISSLLKMHSIKPLIDRSDSQWKGTSGKATQELNAAHKSYRVAIGELRAIISGNRGALTTEDSRDVVIYIREKILGVKALEKTYFSMKNQMERLSLQEYLLGGVPNPEDSGDLLRAQGIYVPEPRADLLRNRAAEQHCLEAQGFETGVSSVHGIFSSAQEITKLFQNAYSRGEWLEDSEADTPSPTLENRIDAFLEQDLVSESPDSRPPIAFASGLPEELPPFPRGASVWSPSTVLDPDAAPPELEEMVYALGEEDLEDTGSDGAWNVVHDAEEEHATLPAWALADELDATLARTSPALSIDLDASEESE